MTFDLDPCLFSCSGDLVLARYTLDENWYRGRVMSVVTDDESSSQEKAEVFYVDYGNTELMPIDRLVRIFLVSIVYTKLFCFD